MPTRTNLIVNRVNRKLATADSVVGLDHRIIIDELNIVQDDIIERALALKSEIHITLEAGTERYDTKSSIYKMSYVAIYDADGKRLSEPEFASSEKQYADAKEAVVHPSFGVKPTILMWDRYLNLTPVPIVTGHTLRVYCYLLASRVLTLDVEPEIDKRWDKALEYGTLAELAGGEWVMKYEAEFLKQSQASMNETVHSLKLDHWSRNLGY